MKKYLMFIILLVTTSGLAGAVTDASAYSISDLIGIESDHGIVRTIVNNQVSTPDLQFNSEGKLDTHLTMDESGSYQMTQGVISNVHNYRGFSGAGRFINSFTGTSVKNIDLNFLGTLNVGFSPHFNPYMMESKTFGMAVAAPGTEKYSLTLTGSQNTITNAALSSPPKWMTEEPKIYTVGYALDNAMMQASLQDLPVDQMAQDLSFDYKILENSLVYYGYDFSRSIQMGDVGFEAEMAFDHIGEV
jgi:hypothetical protein